MGCRGKEVVVTSMGTIDSAAQVQRALLELASEASVTFDSQGTIRSLNEPGQLLFGYDSDAIVGHPIGHLLPGFEISTCEKLLAETDGSDSSPDARVARLEVEGRCRDGTTFLVELSIKRVPLEGGTAFAALARPLLSGDRLRQAEAMLKAVADNTTAVIYIKAPNGRYLLINRRFEDLFDLTSEEVLGNTDVDFMPRETAERLRANDLMVQRRGAPVEFEETVIVDGEVQHYVSLKVPLTDASGKVYAICGISTEITERKRAEMEMADRQEELQRHVDAQTVDLSAANLRLREEAAKREASASQLRELIATAYEGVWTVDLEGKTTFANKRTADMFGYIEEDLIGVHVYGLMDEAQRREADTKMATALEGVTDQYDFEFRRKDGSSLWALVSQSPLRGAGGEIVGVLGMLTDITDRKRAEERQERLAHELDHRVKNNLATVISLADLALASATSIEEFRRSFGSRIRALAHAHESLARARWEDVQFEEVVADVLAPQREVTRGSISTSGESVRIPSRVVTPLAMSLSEFGTNALKYGALSCAGGDVRVEWERPDDAMFELTWTERGGPQVSMPLNEGTGLTMVRGLVEYELRGVFGIDLASRGLRYRIAVPIIADRSDAPRH